MVNKLLLIARMIVSVSVIVILTVALTAIGGRIPEIALWLEKVQLMPAITGFSMVIFIGWLIITLIFGRVYCSSVCALGTLQDVASRCVRAGKHKPRHDYHYSRPMNHLRYVTLLAVVICMMGGIAVLPSLLDPSTAYARICQECFKPVYNLITGTNGGYEDVPWWSAAPFKMGAAALAGAIVAFATLCIVCWIAALNGRSICNTVCPVGTMLGLISRYSIFQIDIDTDKCTQCRRCEHVCKSKCIDLTDHVVDGSRCVNCFNCINVCDNDAIHYSPRRKQLSIPMMQRIDELQNTPETSLDQNITKLTTINPTEITDETIS